MLLFVFFYSFNSLNFSFCLCIHVCGYVFRSWSSVSSSLIHLHLSFLRQSVTQNLQLTASVGLANKRCPLSITWLTASHCAAGIFYGFWGSEFGPSCLCRKHFYCEPSSQPLCPCLIHLLPNTASQHSWSRHTLPLLYEFVLEKLLLWNHTENWSAHPCGMHRSIHIVKEHDMPGGPWVKSPVIYKCSDSIEPDNIQTIIFCLEGKSYDLLSKLPLSLQEWCWVWFLARWPTLRRNEIGDQSLVRFTI